jgi:hypothetical protein
MAVRNFIHLVIRRLKVHLDTQFVKRLASPKRTSEPRWPS